MKKLIFYCPSEIVGGSEILFSRLAISISKKNIFQQVSVLDIENGVLSNLCKNSEKINTIHSFQLDENDDTIIVVPVKCLHQLYELIDDKSERVKICVWQLGSGGFSETLFLPFWLKFKFKTKFSFGILKKLFLIFFSKSLKNATHFLTELIKNKAVFFTDFVGAYETFNDLSLKEINENQINVLPIFIEKEANVYVQKNNFKNHELNIGWLGRISHDFKIHSLTHVIKEITEFNHHEFNQIKFHIVGDGDAFFMIEQLKVEIEKKYPNVSFHLYGALSNIESIEKLINTSDIVVGMGTSSLDCGKFGIPTVIITPVTTEKEVKKIRYRWLYDSLGFSLGEFPNNVKLSNQISHQNFNQLLSEFKKNRIEISNKNHQFVSHFFTSEIALAKFEKYLFSTTYSHSMFKQDFKPIFLSRKFFKKNVTNLYKPKWLPH